MAQRLLDILFLVYICGKTFSSLTLHRKSGFNFRHTGYRRTRLGISLSQNYKLIIFVTWETGQLTFLSGKTWPQTTIFEQVSSYYFYLVQPFYIFLSAIFYLLLQRFHITEKPLFLQCISSSKAFQQVLLYRKCFSLKIVTSLLAIWPWELLFLKDWNGTPAQISIMFSDSQTWRKQNSTLTITCFSQARVLLSHNFSGFSKSTWVCMWQVVLNHCALCKKKQVEERQSLSTCAGQKQWSHTWCVCRTANYSWWEQKVFRYSGEKHPTF